MRAWLLLRILALGPKESLLMAQQRYGNPVAGAAVVVIAAIVVIALFAVRFVNVGEVGVIHTFGVVDPVPKPEGLLLKTPWASLETLSVRTQQLTMSSRSEDASPSSTDQTVRTLTSEGLSVGLDITTLFRLNFSKAPVLFQTIGPNYVEIVVRPAIRDAIRDVVGGYEAESLYTTARTEVANKIELQLRDLLGDRGIEIESILLRDVDLPQQITDAIERKIAAEQSIQERKFRVAEATEEANRRVEEANGIAQANRLINESLTAAVLQDKYISALSEMQSGSVVYVPTNPETGLPVILGSQAVGAGT